MNVAQQTGASDCGLYALAILTCLANNMDPTTVVFDNEELRPHLAKILETRKIAPFPVSKHRKPANPVGKVQSCLVYCHCRLPDDGEQMVCCDNCDEWFHSACECLDSSVSSATWYCRNCI